MTLVKLLLTTALVAAGAAAQAITISPGVEYANAGTLSDGRPYTLGYKFSLSSAVSINALGYWNNGRNTSHQVGIWNAGGTLLGSTTVLGNDQLTGHYRWSAINLTLAAGTYTIGGEFLGDGTFNSYASGVTSIPQYTYLGDEQRYGSGLNFPTTNTGGVYGSNGILKVSFSVGDTVPEPASWALMVAGFGLVGFAARRRSVAVAA